jgi:hypothetical protein
MAADRGNLKIRLLTSDTAPPSPDGTGYRFGLQDSNGRIHIGTPREDGKLAFDFTLTVKTGPDPRTPVFTGPFASGRRDERFVYLSWQRRDAQGYINRVKVRLADLDWSLVCAAQQLDCPLEADMTGRAAGGGRVPVEWRVARD